MVKREGREKGRGYESLRKQLTLTNQNKKLGTMAMLTTEGYSMMVYYKKRFIKDGGIGGVGIYCLPWTEFLNARRFFFLNIHPL